MIEINAEIPEDLYNQAIAIMALAHLDWNTAIALCLRVVIDDAIQQAQETQNNA